MTASPGLLEPRHWTPAGMGSPESLENEIAAHVAANYDESASGYTCKRCSSPIMQTTLYVSVHTRAFNNCAGSGEVRHVPLPFCPKCEGEPDTPRSCIHV